MGRQIPVRTEEQRVLFRLGLQHQIQDPSPNQPLRLLLICFRCWKGRRRRRWRSRKRLWTDLFWPSGTLLWCGRWLGRGLGGRRLFAGWRWRDERSGGLGRSPASASPPPSACSPSVCVGWGCGCGGRWEGKRGGGEGAEEGEGTDRDGIPTRLHLQLNFDNLVKSDLHTRVPRDNDMNE